MPTQFLSLKCYKLNKDVHIWIFHRCIPVYVLPVYLFVSYGDEAC